MKTVYVLTNNHSIYEAVQAALATSHSSFRVIAKESSDSLGFITPQSLVCAGVDMLYMEQALPDTVRLIVGLEEPTEHSSIADKLSGAMYCNLKSSAASLFPAALCELHQRENNERLHYFHLLENLPVGVFIMSFDDKDTPTFRYGNSVIEESTGYSLEEYVALIHSSVSPIHPADRENVQVTFRAWLQQHESIFLHLSYRFRHKKGHYIWLDNYAMKMTDGGQIKEVTQVLIDISDKKDAEEALREALEKERYISQLKAQFVATVSHEFRTPLTGILMTAEKIERYLEKMKPEQQKAELRKIQQRVLDLSGLMDEFILQSSVDALKSNFRAIPLRLEILVKSVTEEMKSLLDSYALSVSLEIEESLPMICGDEQMIRHILRNIFRNAIKYSPNNATIAVSVFFEHRKAVVRIIDQGIGIPEDEIDNVFTPFFRASNALQVQGSGLGLPVVKDFVELHKGSIQMYSTLDKGTEVVIAFPAHEA